MIDPAQVLFKDDICNRTPEVISALTTIIAQSYSGSTRIQDIESIVIANWYISYVNSSYNTSGVLEIRYYSLDNYYHMQNARCYLSQFTDVYKQNTRQQKLNQLL